MDVGAISHLVAAVAFSLLTILLIVSWRGRGAGVVLTVASALTAVWAVIATIYSMPEDQAAPILRIAEVARSAGWIAVLWSVLATMTRKEDRGLGLLGPGPLASGALCLAVALIDLFPAVPLKLGLVMTGFGVGIYGRLAVAVLGLIMAENLYRNTSSERRWSIKHLCFGLGALFAYDLFIYANAILVRALDFDLLVARGAVDAVIVPLIALSAARNRDWEIEVFVSRRVVFHSMTLIAVGGYMLSTAAAGYYLREFGGDWGTLLRMTFLFAAGVLLIVILLSGRARSTAKVLLTKYFLSYRYDYRDEWLKFIRTISSTESHYGLRERAIQAIADIVDSPDGALWMRDDDDGDRFSLVATWNRAYPAADEPADGLLARLLGEREWVVNLDDLRARREAGGDGGAPEWLLEIDRAWLVVPLVHDERLIGFIVLGAPRAPREINWEDYDILKTVGRQAASYLAQEQAARALSEARQFEAFNRRFAFVLHDIKNLVSQLSLMARNAEKHRDNPEFQEDMLQTVRDSVEKMNRLLVRLHAEPTEGRRPVVDLALVLRRLVRDRSEGAAPIELDIRGGGLAVAVDEDRLIAVLDHLIQNALDASGAGDRVRVRLAGRDDEAVIEIEDHGAGMDAAFVRDELFRPFRSTKDTGYGIGAYESREFARAMGGRLDVISAPGEGTIMRMMLPRADVERGREVGKRKAMGR